jgi:hypothetical protein
MVFSLRIPPRIRLAGKTTCVSTTAGIVSQVMNSNEAGAMIDPTHPGLKRHRMTTSTVVFMIFCLCAAGAYGIEDMIPNSGPGLTFVMLIVLPFV